MFYKSYTFLLSFTKNGFPETECKTRVKAESPFRSISCVKSKREWHGSCSFQKKD